MVYEQTIIFKKARVEYKEEDFLSLYSHLVVSPKMYSELHKII